MNALTKEMGKWLITSVALAGLTACGGDSDSSLEDVTDVVDTGTTDTTDQVVDSQGVTSLKVNAASYTDWVFVSLTEGKVLELTAEEAETSTDWQLALRRTAIKVNGGDSGSGNVSVALADAQDDFYNGDGSANASVFMNADADIEEAALLVAYDTSTLSYVQDSNEPALTDWYVYDFMTHQISADTSVGYLIRHADGATYSKLFIDAASYTGMTVRYETQAAGTSQFAGDEETFSVEFGEDETLVCLDFDTVQSMDCAADGWELQYEVDLSARAINLWTNGGVFGTGNGAVFGAIDAEALAGYTSATVINTANIASHYSQDSSTGLFAEQSWYAYNLGGNHKLWPNFRTYVVNTDSSTEGSTQFALQVSNYYSLEDSGSPELRFIELATDGE